MTFSCLPAVLQLSVSLFRVAHRNMGEGLVWGAWVLWRKCLSLSQQWGTVWIFQERFGFRTPFPFGRPFTTILYPVLPPAGGLERIVWSQGPKTWSHVTPVPAVDCGVLGWWLHVFIHIVEIVPESYFTVLLHPSADFYPVLKMTAGCRQVLSICW